jgi:hypothetical protein
MRELMLARQYPSSAGFADRSLSQWLTCILVKVSWRRFKHCSSFSSLPTVVV